MTKIIFPFRIYVSLSLGGEMAWCFVWREWRANKLFDCGIYGQASHRYKYKHNAHNTCGGGVGRL